MLGGAGTPQDEVDDPFSTLYSLPRLTSPVDYPRSSRRLIAFSPYGGLHDYTLDTASYSCDLVVHRFLDTREEEEREGGFAVFWYCDSSPLFFSLLYVCREAREGKEGRRCCTSLARR